MDIRRTVLVGLLGLLALLNPACSLISGLDATPTIPPTLTPTYTPAPTATLTLQPGFGELMREEYGGFTYMVPAGYDVNADLGIVSMLAKGALPEIGPSISLIGSAPAPDATAQSLLDILKDSPGTVLSEPTPVIVGGYDGLGADIRILNNEFEIVGRIIAVVTPENQFLALAGGPEERWEDELKPIFEAILSSITFFTPTEGDPDDVTGKAPGSVRD